MAVSAITFGATSGVNSKYFTPVRSLYQTPKTVQTYASKPYEVTLTTAAKAKSMELQGYSVFFISSKLGLDTKTVGQFLGITVAPDNITFKTTYTQPKSTYAAPKASYTEPQTLTQDRASLASDLTQLPTNPYRASQLIASATKNAA